MRDVTLCIPIREDRILLGNKKRGFGKDKLNGFGGKISEGETIIQAALRELYEESGILGHEDNLIKHAEIEFFFPESKKDWNQRVHIFLLNEWQGIPKESEEMTCEWHSITEIPFHRMWDDDKHWLPLVLEGKKIRGAFRFQEDNNSIESFNLDEIDSFE